MFRSLHMKLMLIMTLLIVSLMTVVGAFLVNSVSGFYLDQFYAQMQGVFQNDAEFCPDLQNAAPGEENGAEQIGQMLETYTGNLGVDGRRRNYYVLDGTTGAYLTGSNDSGGSNLDMTHNLSWPWLGRWETTSTSPPSYMDVAIPMTRGGGAMSSTSRTPEQTVQNLTSQLVTLILEALAFGLVISVLLSFLLSKTLITPIERLTEGAEEVAEGDFSHKIEVDSRDEIGVLTATFNDMAGQLQNTIQEVENERNKLDTLFLHMTDGVVAFSKGGDHPVQPRRRGDAGPGAAHRGRAWTTPPFLGTSPRWIRSWSREQEGYVAGALELGRAEPGIAAGPL